MRWTWSLVADAVAGDGQLDLVGAVLDHRAPGPGRGGQGQAARLTDRHGGAGVDLEQDPLDDHHVGPQLGQQPGQLVPQGGQPLAERVAGRASSDARRPPRPGAHRHSRTAP